MKENKEHMSLRNVNSTLTAIIYYRSFNNKIILMQLTEAKVKQKKSQETYEKKKIHFLSRMHVGCFFKKI